MNETSLSDLAYSISYWGNEELEQKLPSFLRSLLASLDCQDTRNRAALIVQQIIKRFQQSKVR